MAKTVAELHDRPLKRINELINNHLKDGYFEESIDYIDLKENKEFEVVLKDHGIFTQNALNRSTNIYLLSQQGYTLLLKLMDTDLARKQYKEVIRKYFMLQEAVKKLTPEDLQRLVAREDGIIRRNRETQAISGMIKNGELADIKCSPYALATNTTYDLLYGMYKKEIIQYLDLKERDNLRDFLSKKDLEQIREIEDEIHWMHKKRIYMERHI